MLVRPGARVYTGVMTERGDWQAVDLMSTEVVGWYHSEIEAWEQNKGRVIDVFYKPSRRRKVRK